MDNTLNVFCYLETLTEINKDESELSKLICANALKEISAKLKSGINTDDIRIISAAGAVAFYRLTIRRNSTRDSDRVTNFKAGDITVTKEYPDKPKQIENAEKIMNDALMNVIPLCEDTEFVFRKVD